MNTTNDLLSPAEVAATLGVHIDTIRAWIRSGKLPAARLGYRTIRVRRSDIDALLSRAGKAFRPAGKKA